MRAIRIHRFGGPEVLQLDQVGEFEAKDGKLVIKVAAASVNPVDYKIRQGGYPKVKTDDLPITLGRDVAGVVQTSTGGFERGDEVYAHLGWEDGGYADYALCKPSGVALKPASLDLTQAAAVPLAATTAWQGLFDHGGLKPGQRVLIHGAAGGVGGFAVQFAKAKGAYVLATASGEGLAQVKALGADMVIDYEKDRFETTAQDIDLVYDLIGKTTQERSFATLKPSGTLISTVALTETSKAIADERHIKAERYMAEPNAEELAEIGKLIDEGKVKVMVAKTFPLENASDAHRALETEHPRGKIVLLT
jgi:NADPH:quinone reductase-like Zn-dependent oxidoreductase